MPILTISKNKALLTLLLFQGWFACCLTANVRLPLVQAPPDTAKVEPAKRFKDPKKAMVYSLILPGAGQFYNGRWWKTPLVYGAIGGTLAVAINNQQNYRIFQEAYLLKLQQQTHRFSGTVLDDSRRLRVFRDRFDKGRQSWYIFSVAVYGLQAVEALVDAHLQDFDVSEDLSIQLKPTLSLPALGPPMPGFGIFITF
jgi:hypothetical protein